MKEKCKRYGWDIILFCNLFLIALFILKIINKYESMYQTANESADTINNISIHFIIDTYSMIDFTFLEDEEIPFALLQKKSESLPAYKVIYSNDYFEVKEGRNFTDSDFRENKHVGLVGNRAEEVMEIDPFKINDQEYTIVGKQSEKNSLESKYAVFYTDGTIDKSVVNSECILVGLKEKDIEKVYKTIENKMKSMGYEIKRLDINSTKFKDVYNINQNSLSIGILVSILSLSTILLISYFWLGQFDEFHAVYYLFGVKNLISKIYLRFITILFFSYAFAFLIQKTIFLVTGIGTFLILCIIMPSILLGGIVYKKKGDWNEENSGRNNI